MSEFSKKIILVSLIIIFAVFQKNSFFQISGIQPNLMLALLLASAFFVKNFLFYLLLIVLEYSILKTEPYFDWPVFLFSFLLIIDFLIARHSPWQPFFTFLILLIATPLLFYTALSFPFVIKNILLVIKEIGYNLVISVLFYETGKKYLAF